MATHRNDGNEKASFPVAEDFDFKHHGRMKIFSLPIVLWLIAFCCSLFFLNDFEMELFALSVLVLSVWIIHILLKTIPWSTPKSYVIYALGLFWALTFVSVIMAEVFFISLLAFVYFSVLPLSFFGWIMKKDTVLMERLFPVLVGLFVLLSLWALGQYFFIADLPYGRAHHPLSNPNSLAALFNFSILAGIGFVLLAEDRTKRWLGAAFSVLALGGLMATGSRGAFFAMVPMVMGLLIAAWLLWRDRVRSALVPLLVILAGLCVWLVLSQFGQRADMALAERLGDTFVPMQQDISNGRTALWAASWQMIKEHGLFGTGIGTYYLYFPEFRLPQDIFGANHAHSDPLQFWAELGIAGIVLFYVLVGLVVGRTIAACRKTKDHALQARILIPFFAMGTMILHTHVTFHFYNLSLLFMMGVGLAYWFLMTQRVLQTPLYTDPYAAGMTPSVRWTIVVLPFLIMGGIFGAFITSELYLKAAKWDLAQAKFDQFAEDIIAAQTWSLEQNDRAFILAGSVPMVLLKDRKDLDPAKRQEIFDQAVSYYYHAAAVNPRSAPAYYHLGLIQSYAATEVFPEALQTPEYYYRKALKLDPLYYPARIALANLMDQDHAALAILTAGSHYFYRNPEAMVLYTTIMSRALKIRDIKLMQEMQAKAHAFQQRVAIHKKRADAIPF